MINIWVFSISKLVSKDILLSEEYQILKNNLHKKYGINLIFSTNFFDVIEWWKAENRANQLHELIKNDNIDVLWAFTWWSASNEVLQYLDYELIKEKNKKIIGYSDVTVILNAIYHKSWVKSLLWPNIKTLLKWFNFQCESEKYLFSLISWLVDKVNLDSRIEYFDPSVNNIIKSPWIQIVNHGITEWITIGWNLSSITLLAWTKYFETLAWKILFLEECSEFSIWIIRRNLFQLRELEWFYQLKGVVFWFINQDCLRDYWYTVDQTILDVFWDVNFPVIQNVTIWHISPMQTIPIWCKCLINTKNKEYNIYL